MPISFACGQCGKDYVVSDGLGGKRAVCKACGNRMSIPGGAPAAPTPVATAPSRPSTATAAAPRPAPSPRPAVAARPAAFDPPAGDVYGFDEAPAPLPPRASLGGEAHREEAGGPVPKPRKAKKKSSGGSSFRLTGIGVGGIRLLVIGVFVVIGIITRFGLSSKSDVEKFVTTLIANYGQATTTLKSIQSQATAKTAAPKLQADLDRIIQTWEASKHKKANQKDIDDIANRYRGQLAGAATQFQQELQRIGQIPGVIAALNIMPKLERIDALALEAAKP